MNVANFPYSVHDEPADDWTIEELLQWCLLQSQHKTTMKRDEIMNTFQEIFNNGKQEIMELQKNILNKQQQRQQQHYQQQEQVQQSGGDGNGCGDVDVDVDDDTEMGGEEAVKKQHGEKAKEAVMKEDISPNGSNHQNDENQHPNKTTSINTTKQQQGQEQKPAKNPTTIQIEIISGPHAKSKKYYTLKPKYKKPCWVGRSTSKKFLDRGISLNKDDEVSTTHGKFHVHPSGAKGKLVFTDTGSTNGTVYNDVEIEDNVPLELVDGMILVIGNSHLLIQLS